MHPRASHAPGWSLPGHTAPGAPWPPMPWCTLANHPLVQPGHTGPGLPWPPIPWCSLASQALVPPGHPSPGAPWPASPWYILASQALVHPGQPGPGAPSQPGPGAPWPASPWCTLAIQPLVHPGQPFPGAPWPASPWCTLALPVEYLVHPGSQPARVLELYTSPGSQPPLTPTNYIFSPTTPSSLTWCSPPRPPPPLLPSLLTSHTSPGCWLEQAPRATGPARAPPSSLHNRSSQPGHARPPVAVADPPYSSCLGSETHAKSYRCQIFQFTSGTT